MFCAAFAMMITVALSFPLYIFACKQIWLGIVYGNDVSAGDQHHKSDFSSLNFLFSYIPQHVASRFKSNVFASLIFYGSFLCGMFFSGMTYPLFQVYCSFPSRYFSDILTVIGILGSVTAPLVVFIMPACMALKVGFEVVSGVNLLCLSNAVSDNAISHCSSVSTRKPYPGTRTLSLSSEPVVLPWCLPFWDSFLFSIVLFFEQPISNPQGVSWSSYWLLTLSSLAWPIVFSVSSNSFFMVLIYLISFKVPSNTGYSGTI